MSDVRGADRSRSPRGPAFLEESDVPITFAIKKFELDIKRKEIEVSANGHLHSILFYFFVYIFNKASLQCASRLFQIVVWLL